MSCRCSRVNVDREEAWSFPYGGEPHSRIIRAGRSASFAHPIRVASPAGVAGGIDIGTVVRRCHDQHAIAVDVDVARGRPAPGETHRIYSPTLRPAALSVIS